MLGFEKMSKFWDGITYYRHRSELLALGLAMRVPLLAMLPIGIAMGFWWVIAPLPLVIPIYLLLANLGQFGAMILPILVIPVLVLLSLSASWFFEWYGIAASLMFGRFTSAKAKENALEVAIHAYQTKAI